MIGVEKERLSFSWYMSEWVSEYYQQLEPSQWVLWALIQGLALTIIHKMGQFLITHNRIQLMSWRVVLFAGSPMNINININWILELPFYWHPLAYVIQYLAASI